jgi:hypothetical protein
MGSARGSKFGTPMSTDTRPSSRTRARTVRPRCPSANSRPSSGALVQQRRDTARAVAALLDLGAVGIEHSIEHAAPGRAGLEHQRLIEADAGMPVGEGAQFVRVQVGLGGGGVEYQEIVAQPLHLQKLDAHARA